MKPIQVKKIRVKRRSNKSFDLCPYCGCPNCDNMGKIGIGMRKIQSRLKADKCLGCGKDKDKCSCKSKM